MRHIYILTDNDIPFYVGQSKNVRKRFSTHKAEAIRMRTEKDRRISQILFFDRKLEYQIICNCSTKDANNLEKSAILMLQQLGINLINKDIPKEITKPFIVASNKLTPIEIEVLQCLANDKQTSEIVEIVWRSQRSIETIRRRILTKLKSKTIAGAIYKAYKKSLIT